MEAKRLLNGKRTVVATGMILLLILTSLPLLATLTRCRSLAITLAFTETPQDVLNRRIKSVDTNLTQKPLDLTNLIHSLDLGWERPPPKWLIDLCPEVVEHFNKFPSFQKLPHPSAPFMTTEYAAHSVCTLKIAKLIASSMLKTHLYLHAGSHLGAILHGQMMVWDDDVDAIMSYQYMEEFFSICQDGHRVHEDAEFRCVKDAVSIKVWLQSSDMAKQTANGREHYSPFVDLFFFNITETGRLQEVPLWEERETWSFPIPSFFPTQSYYFGGLHIMGPNSKLAKDRYDFNICKTALWNHRLEGEVPEFYRNKMMDCKILAKRFPFRQPLDLVTNGNHSQRLVSIEHGHLHLKTKTSVAQRAKWFHDPSDVGQHLTDGLQGLNEVEVDNTISSVTSCTTDGDKLRVVEFNAERGKWWLEAASNLDELKHAHVIILNGMDIGMARSDQQHTTRQMARFLGMNYVWGLEFVELTIGNKQDRESTPYRLPNFNGLRGNAFLTRCAIDDAVIYRNQVGDYFSNEKKWLNANGLEKRLGGRMILMGRIIIDDVPVVIGSVNKLGRTGQSSYGPEIAKYIGSSKAVIAGDQHESFCRNVGLKAVLPKDHKGNTWPASCKGFGSWRGDNICTNMEEIESERTTKPCVTELGFETELGEHALTGVVLSVSSAK